MFRSTEEPLTPAGIRTPDRPTRSLVTMQNMLTRVSSGNNNELKAQDKLRSAAIE